MDTWYEYVCLECGYGGLTRNPQQYQRGHNICPRCGSLRFDVQERGLAPLNDEDELELANDD